MKHAGQSRMEVGTGGKSISGALLCAFAACVLAFAADAQTVAQPAGATATTATAPNASGPASAVVSGPADVAAVVDESDYRLGNGDVMQVSVLNADQFNRKLRVDAIGNVSLPLLGNIHVAGLTPREIETVIADFLRAKYMNDPQVSIFLEESASQRFSIEGAVKTPNVYPLKGRVTLLQALALGGGLTKVADQNQVRVIRGEGASQQILVFDAELIREGKLSDPVIQRNDAIIAVTSTAKMVFYETLDTIRGIVSFGTVR